MRPTQWIANRLEHPHGRLRGYFEWVMIASIIGGIIVMVYHLLFFIWHGHL